MAAADVEASIARPVEDVFAVLTDPEKTGRWFPVDVEEHWTSPPPHGVGSTRHAVIRMLGRTTENDAVVTAYEPPHRGALEVRSAGVVTRVLLDFAAVDGGTRVHVSMDATSHGPMRLALWLFLRWYAGAWRRGLANVKARMESGQDI